MMMKMVMMMTMHDDEDDDDDDDGKWWLYNKFISYFLKYVECKNHMSIHFFF